MTDVDASSSERERPSPMKGTFGLDVDGYFSSAKTSHIVNHELDGYRDG